MDTDQKQPENGGSIRRGDVVLRPMEPTDMETIQRWLSDRTAARYCGRERERLRSQQIDNTQNRGQPNDLEAGEVRMYIIEVGSSAVGLIEYSHYNSADQSAAISVLVGEVNARRKQYGITSLRALLDYLYSERGIERVWLTVNVENRAAIACFTKCGFDIDKILKEAEEFEGRKVDNYLMSLTVPAFRNREVILQRYS